MFSNIKGDIEAYNKKVGLFNLIYLIFFNSGFFTIFLFRCYSYLYKKNLILKVISKIIQRMHEVLTSCYFSPLAKIEAGLKLPHPVGIVIGEGVSIGKNNTLYQGVTLGKGPDNKYPIMGNHCVIFANSVLIGEIVLSDKCIIGANSFVNKDVPELSIFAGVPAKLIKYQG
ncbi:hypothetical protein LIS44_14690 [Acinetobacter haemolyticus]|nr:hypothetical protein LIS44_14690 [Acinetobacter haemolyticus]